MAEPRPGAAPSEGQGEPAPKPPSAELKPNELRGGLFLIGAVSCFSVAFLIIKQLSVDLPEPMIGFLRSVFAVLFFLPMILMRGVGFLATSRPFSHFWRSAFGYASFLIFIYAVARLPLGDAVALSFTSPFWSILIGALVFGDKLTIRLGIAVAIGFSGVLLIAQPSAASGLGFGAMLAISSAVFTSLAMMMVKQLSGTEPPDRTAFYFMFVSGFVAVIPAALDWQWPSAHHWPGLIAIGALFYAGQLMLTRGYTYGTFSRIAPLDFVRLPLSLLLGYLWFGEVPATLAVGGMALIVLASLDLLLSGRKKAS